jgi:hypothetical protein
VIFTRVKDRLSETSGMITAPKTNPIHNRNVA